MANPTPEVIQKDLGIVTAYGYALAGGYQGTEQQFIHDFNELMSGHYSGSQLNTIYYSSETTVKPNDLFVCDSNNASINGISGFVYGNITWLEINARTTQQVTNSGSVPCVSFSSSMSAGLISDDKYKSIYPRKSSNVFMNYGIAGTIGFSNGSSIPDVFCPYMTVYLNGDLEMEFGVQGRDNSSATIEQNTFLIIKALYFNQRG